MRDIALRTLVLAAATAVVGAQGPAPMPAGTHALLGRVLEVGTNAPVAAAVVTVTGPFDLAHAPETATPLTPAAAFPSLNVMTTADGYFVLRNIPAGLYTAAIRAAGYINSDYPPELIDVRDSQKPTERVLRLWRFAAIGGRITDEHGEPIAGIPVHALQRVVSGAGILLERAAVEVTDDRGEYRFGQLRPGEYAVGVLSTTSTLPEEVAATLDPSPANREPSRAMVVELIQSGYSRSYGDCTACLSGPDQGHHVGGFVLERAGVQLPPAPDGRPLGFANTFYPGTTRAADASMILLGSGESRSGLDMVVPLVRTATVGGTLTGPDGPMPHMAVNLVPPGVSGSDFNGTGRAMAITNARGAFMFLGVAPGEYTLSTTLTEILNDASGEGRSLWAQQPVTVGDTDVEHLEITARPGIRISGRVDYVGATSGTAPERTLVALQPVGAGSWRTSRAIVQPDGTFRSAGDPAGRYLVFTGLSPSSGWFWQTTSLAGKPLPDELVELGREELSGLVLTFGRTTNHISGHVSDTNAGDARTAVIVFPADSTLWRDGIFSTRREREVLATPTGAFDVATLSPGEYYVAAVDAERAQDWRQPGFLASLVAGATRVTLGPEDQKNVSLRVPPQGRAQ